MMREEEKAEKVTTSTEALIDKARSKYPVSLYFRGRLTKEELSEIEKKCYVNFPTVYMDGSAMYSIRYKM